MIEFLRNWIISVVVMVIFVVFIDMILPENSIKKYARFVTGLIVVITILTPVFKLFDRDADIETYISQYAEVYNTEVSNFNSKNIQESIQEQTMEVFKEKLKEKIEKDIYDGTGKKYKVTRLEIKESSDENIYDSIDIEYIELKPQADSRVIQSVDKVVIGRKVKDEGQKKDETAVNMLKTKYNIDPSAIKFIK